MGAYSGLGHREKPLVLSLLSNGPEHLPVLIATDYLFIAAYHHSADIIIIGQGLPTDDMNMT
jgi:hypothetical protein